LLNVKIRTLIVDDEPHARTRLRQLLAGETDFEIVAECSNGRQAVETAGKEKPDLMFLDVQMPRLNGFDVCAALGNTSAPVPLVVFVTAYDQYALRAFDVHAMDYLLKPFDRERFRKTLERVRSQLGRRAGEETQNRLAALLTDLRSNSQRPDRLVFKENGRVIFLRAETIDWIEADGNYVKLHSGNDLHHVRETLAGLEAQLPMEKFMRISRSTIVNLDRIRELQPMFYGDYTVLLHSGAKLSMSRNFRDRLEKFLARRV
jgi:two-component system, LytTR family, response regulator